MPFGFHLTVDTLPSGDSQGSGFRFALARIPLSLRARLGFSIPSTSSGPRGITPVFGYDAPHPSVRRTLTFQSNALLSTHYGPLGLPPDSGRFQLLTLYARSLPDVGCRVGSLLFPHNL